MDDNSDANKNAQGITKEKVEDFTSFKWHFLEVTSEYLIVYENFGEEKVNIRIFVLILKSEKFKKDAPSIITNRENELAITPIVFTELKRECGESPTKRFCSVTEYRKLGKELNDVTFIIYLFNYRCPNPYQNPLISSPGKTLVLFWCLSLVSISRTISFVPTISLSQRESITLCLWQPQALPLKNKRTF